MYIHLLRLLYIMKYRKPRTDQVVLYKMKCQGPCRIGLVLIQDSLPGQYVHALVPFYIGVIVFAKDISTLFCSFPSSGVKVKVTVICVYGTTSSENVYVYQIVHFESFII